MEELKSTINQLSKLSEESWEIFSDCFTKEFYKKGESILKIGEVCEAIYFVQLGFLKLVSPKNGKTINIEFYFENEFATNIKSLLENSKSNYEIISGEDSIVLKIDKVKLLRAYKKSHEIESFGRKFLENLIADQQTHANSFKLFTPHQRYQNLYTSKPHIFQRISLTQIASYLGISRETLCRIRAK